MTQRQMTDENGTPFRNLYIGNTIDRQVSEMLGLAKGIICDGVVNDAEALALRQWLGHNSDVTVAYPGNYLASRVVSMYQDGVVDDEERAELRELLMEMVGEPEGLTGSMNEPTRLPFDKPAPTVLFDGKEFVFTGVFAYGTRKKCEAEVIARGGRVYKAITHRADYLVVGLTSSPAWVQSAHGRKIEEAASMKLAGHRIAIIGEEHWIEALQFDAH